MPLDAQPLLDRRMSPEQRTAKSLQLYACLEQASRLAQELRYMEVRFLVDTTMMALPPMGAPPIEDALSPPSCQPAAPRVCPETHPRANTD